jgi:WD40 repeat protein
MKKELIALLRIMKDPDKKSRGEKLSAMIKGFEKEIEDIEKEFEKDPTLKPPPLAPGEAWATCYDAKTGLSERRIVKKPIMLRDPEANRVTNIALSGDGRWVAASDDNSLSSKTVVWDRRTQKVSNVLDGWTGTFLADSSSLIVETRYTSQVVEIPKGSISARLKGLSRIKGDGLGILSWSKTGKLRQWLLGEKKVTLRELNHNSPLEQLYFSPDYKYIASKHGDNVIRVWDFESLDLLYEFPARAKRTASSIYVRFAHSRNMLWIYEANNIRIYSCTTGKLDEEIEIASMAHESAERSTTAHWFFCPADYAEDVVNIHDVELRAYIGTLSYPRRRQIVCSKDGRYFAVCTHLGVIICNAHTLERVCELPGWTAKFDPKSDLIWVGDTEGSVIAYNIESGKQEERYSLCDVLANVL